MSLEEYLNGEYNRDLQDISDVEKVLLNVAALFVDAFDKSKNAWPYQLRSDQLNSIGDPSQGTAAMILAALGKICGLCTLRDKSRSATLLSLPKQLQPVFRKGLAALSKQLIVGQTVQSGTFGENDPLTVSHLTELMRSLGGINGGRRIVKIAGKLSTTGAEIARLFGSNPAEEILPQAIAGRKWCAGSAFIALRIVRAQEDINNGSLPKNETYSTVQFWPRYRLERVLDQNCSARANTRPFHYASWMA